MRHDTWMTIVSGHKDVQSCACSCDEMWSICSVCVVTHCANLYMLFVWVFCSHPPSVVWKFFSIQPKLVLTLRKKIFTKRQTVKNAWNSHCSSSNGFDPNLMTMTKLSAGFPATLCRTSSLFQGQRVVVFFDALECSSFSLSYLWTPRNMAL